MRIEFSGVATANLAKTAKDGQTAKAGFPSSAMANLANLANFDAGESGFSQISRFSHSQLSEITFSSPPHARLSDAQLTQLIRQTAKANNVTETAIRAWLGDEIEALRSGDPAELKAFPTCVEQARLNGDSQDNPLLTIDRADSADMGNHGGESGPVRCADCGHAEKLDHPVLVRCGAGRMAPGACGAWWSSTPHLCGEFAPIITSTSTSETNQ